MASVNKQELRKRFIDGRGTWTPDWEDLLDLDHQIFEQFVAMRDVPQGTCYLSPKVQEFIYIAVHASATTVYSPAVREHVKMALDLGASVEEVTEVIGLTSLVGVHTVTLGAPILLEILEEEGMESKIPSTANDARREQIKDEFVKARGFWTDTWNPILRLDPDFFEAYMRFSALPSRRNVLDAKVRELLYCAFDAATTHLYGRGTKIHMRNAIHLGATPAEVMEMLELVSFVGMNGVVNGASIVAQELRERQRNGNLKRGCDSDITSCKVETNGGRNDSPERHCKKARTGDRAVSSTNGSQ